MEEKNRKKLVALHKKTMNEQESAWIKQKMQKHNTIEKSFELAVKLSNEAMSVMKNDTELIGILQIMIKRSY